MIRRRENTLTRLSNQALPVKHRDTARIRPLQQEVADKRIHREYTDIVAATIATQAERRGGRAFTLPLTARSIATAAISHPASSNVPACSVRRSRVPSGSTFQKKSALPFRPFHRPLMTGNSVSPPS